MTGSVCSPLAIPKNKRSWTWTLGALFAVLVSGLVPPAAIGLEPTLETLEARFQAVDRGVTIRELCDTLGMEPVAIELRSFKGHRPFGEIETLDLGDQNTELWSLKPVDLPTASGERQLIQLTFEPNDPWLIAAWRNCAHAINRWRSPGAGTLSGRLGLTRRELSPRQFKALGSFERSWCGWREDLPPSSNPARLHALKTLLEYVDLKGAEIWEVQLPPKPNGAPR